MIARLSARVSLTGLILVALAACRAPGGDPIGAVARADAAPRANDAASAPPPLPGPDAAGDLEPSPPAPDAAPLVDADLPGEGDAADAPMPPDPDAAPDLSPGPPDLAAPDSAPPVDVAPPTPNGSCLVAQRGRLRIRNHCAQPIWLQHSPNVTEPQNVRLGQDECHDYAIPDAALSATRFWPKTGCGPTGDGCKTGQSVVPCPPTGCHPPIESKFEATWANPKICPARDAAPECLTWYNASQVNGYTLPFKITPHGPGSDAPGCGATDCSQLDLARCPTAEDLGGGEPDLASVDLRVFDPDDPSKVIGCMSPCKKLNFDPPYGLGLAERSDPTVDFCCPTPPISAEQCREGPVVTTEYVKRLRQMCPAVDGFPHDVASGLHACPAQTRFEVVFCP